MCGCMTYTKANMELIFEELLLTEAAQKEFYFKLYKMHLYHQKNDLSDIS